MSQNKGPKRVLLLNGVSADETTSQPIDVLGYDYVTFYVEGTGTINAGVLTIEEADYDALTEVPYGGDWSSITTMNTADVTGGKTKALHLTVASYGHVRARISDAVGGGGSIKVRIAAN